MNHYTVINDRATRVFLVSKKKWKWRNGRPPAAWRWKNTGFLWAFFFFLSLAVLILQRFCRAQSTDLVVHYKKRKHIFRPIPICKIIRKIIYSIYHEVINPLHSMFLLLKMDVWEHLLVKTHAFTNSTDWVMFVMLKDKYISPYSDF